jgi:hypothetical protein
MKFEGLDQQQPAQKIEQKQQPGMLRRIIDFTVAWVM